MVAEAVAGDAARAEAQESLLAKASDWITHVFYQKSVKSVTRKAMLVKEGLNEARALDKGKVETLQWLEYLPSGIRESKRLALFTAVALLKLASPML